MMAEHMSLQKALAIASELSAAYKKHGAQMRPPYRQYQIVEALSVLLDELNAGNAKAVTEAKEAVTAANRRAGAAESRLKRCMGKTGKTAVELDGMDDVG